MKKKLLAVLLCVVMVISVTACNKGGGEDEPKPTPSTGTETTKAPDNDNSEQSPDDGTAKGNYTGDTVVIRYGTHWVNALDPLKVDDVTGEYTMGNEAERQAALKGLEAIKDELDVEFEFVQYADNTVNALMTSVLAGNPVCDIAVLWAGSEATVLGQNILQQLDDYAYIFEDEDVSWMFLDKMYGHNYLLKEDQRYMQLWPLVCNLTMIEKVDSLKVDGKTKYPMDYFVEGNWTWDVFTDYLTKINAYYANVPAPDGSKHDTVQAYTTDYRFAALSAAYSAGGGIYHENGLAVESDATIKGVQYIADLRSKGLVVEPGIYDDGFTPEWTAGGEEFNKSATVFTDCPGWLVYGSDLASRDESLAVIPWPRPSDMAFDDPEYKQVLTYGDTVGILKGINPERTELALQAFKLYWETYYKSLGGTDTVQEYYEKEMVPYMATLGLDVYSEEYGDQLIESFGYISKNFGGDSSTVLGLWVPWHDIVGKSYYGLGGMSSYDVAVKANMTDFTNVINRLESILGSNEVVDNQKPEIKKEKITISAGTDRGSVDWTQYFTAEDAVDGDLDMSTGTYIVNDNVDFSTPGKYDDGIEVKISDLSGNEESTKQTIYIFNSNNTTAPTMTAVDELPTVEVDKNAAEVSWKDFIATAEDVDGLDLKDNISADLSELDTTTVGTYNVELTVTDYAGNETNITVAVTVAAE